MATPTSTMSEKYDNYGKGKSSKEGAAVASEPTATGAAGQRGNEPTVTPTQMRPTVKYINLG